MRSLPVVARLFPAILSGDKTHTIRWREPRIVQGPMAYVSEATGRRAVVEVTRVTDLPRREAAALVGMQAARPPEVMLAGMRAHYPRITLDDIVQVAEHRPCPTPADRAGQARAGGVALSSGPRRALWFAPPSAPRDREPQSASPVVPGAGPWRDLAGACPAPSAYRAATDLGPSA